MKYKGAEGPYCPYCRNARKLAEQNPRFDIHEHVKVCKRLSLLHLGTHWAARYEFRFSQHGKTIAIATETKLEAQTLRRDIFGKGEVLPAAFGCVIPRHQMIIGYFDDMMRSLRVQFVHEEDFILCREVWQSADRYNSVRRYRKRAPKKDEMPF